MSLRKQSSPNKRSKASKKASLLTFYDHINELRRRLFWIVAFVIVAAAAAFPFQQHIMHVLTIPLGGQQLYYITPIGGFSFLIKVCTYVGVLAGIPLIIYHLYRFLEPLMQNIKKSVLFYVTASSLLALCGILFAYFISLPAALHFLTNINIGQVTAMLTVDSYLTFVMTYLLGAALLFQIPLVLMIINGITPLPPKQLMNMQRYVLLGAFVVAAIISPTPDIVNQTFLAVPIIVMYQVGIGSVWVQQRKQQKVVALSKRFENTPLHVAERNVKQVYPTPLFVSPPTPIVMPKPVITPLQQPALRKQVVVRNMDGFAPIGAPTQVKQGHAIQPIQRRTMATRQVMTPIRVAVQPRNITVPKRSVDGIVVNRAPFAPTT